MARALRRRQVGRSDPDVEAKGLKPETIRDVYFFPAEWGPVANMAKKTARVGATASDPAERATPRRAPRGSPAPWC